MRIKREEIAKMVKENEYYSIDRFIDDARRYIKAIKEGRVICNIESVSRSGMSRKMVFLSCEKSNYKGSGINYQYRNFYALFKAFGYSFGDRRSFRVDGCGMDMVFNTNYNNMHNLQSLGFITKDQCSHLAQQTPTVI